MNTKKSIILAAAIFAGTLQFGTIVATSVFAQNEKVTICHAAGQDGTMHYNTLTISPNAVYGRNGNAGHFSENGTPAAGHENDYFGECRTESDSSPEPTTEPTPTSEPTPTPTATPNTSPASNNNSNNSDNTNNDSGSVQGTSDSQGGEVLGTYAGTGVFTDVMMNTLGYLGTMLSGVGAVLYAKKKD